MTNGTNGFCQAWMRGWAVFLAQAGESVPPGSDDPVCARCGSLAVWMECFFCEDGFSEHDCGEDTCCCAEPEPNVACDICDGFEGWWACGSSEDWCQANPMPGRENVEPGEIDPR